MKISKISVLAQLQAVFVLILLQSIATHSATNGSKIVRLLTVLPYPTKSFIPSWSEGRNIIPAMNIAVAMINNSTDILRDYTLELVVTNGGCDAENEALVSFVGNVVGDSTARIGGLIGPGCSASTLAVVPIVNRISLINVHGAGTPLLENRELYPNSFGVLGSAQAFVDAVVKLVHHTGWKRIATLFESSREYFFYINKALSDGIQSDPIAEIEFASTVYHTYYPLATIKEQGLRIVVVMAGPMLTQNILCLAYHRAMLYPDYQWILVSREVSEFNAKDISFHYEGISYECREKLFLDTILKGSLLLNYQLKPFNETARTDLGLSFEEYDSKYRAQLRKYNQTSQIETVAPTIWAGMYYDAVWTLALAFNQSGIDIEQYYYGDRILTSILREKLYSLDFNGVSGRIAFNSSTGYVNRRINLYQVNNNGRQLFFGYIESNGSFADTTELIYIPDTFQTQLNPVFIPLTVVFGTLTLVLIAFIITTHIVVLMYPQYHSIKASSPKLNHVIYIGSYIWSAASFSYVVFFYHPSSIWPLCHLMFIWSLPMAYTLSLGMVTAKTWRLYRVFVHYLNPGPFISNRALLCFVLFLLAIDATLAMLWTILNSIFNTQSLQDTLICHSDYWYVWLTIMGCYKLVLLQSVIVLSFATRGINSRNFTTNCLQIFSYLHGGLLLLLFPAYLITVSQENSDHAHFVIMCTLLDGMLILLLACVFIPPVWPLVLEKAVPWLRVWHIHIRSSHSDAVTAS